MICNSPNNYSMLSKKLVAALALLLSPISAYAQSHPLVNIKSNGTEGSLVVTDAATTAVHFRASARGNLSQYVEFHAAGPSGIKGYVEVRQVKRGGKLGPVYRLQFAKKKGFTTELVDGSSQSLIKSASATANPSKEQLDRIREKTGLSDTVIKILLGIMTEEEIIAQYGKKTTTPSDPSGPSNPSNPSNPTPKTEPGELEGTALLSKDACDKAVSEYQLTFVVDLSGVDRAAAGSSFTVTASVETEDGKAVPASIKPISDGKFAPKPLILVQSPGYAYGSSNALKLITWKNGRPGKGKTIKIEDYVYYRGQSLARAIAAGVLNGGKGTFEISNSNAVGTACFNLIRTRQRVNGYKGGD